MTGPLRILITGFGPFPGAPYNPTPALVTRLLRLRRPAFGEVQRIGHIFPVSYRAVDDQLPALIVQHCPDVLLMFGLASRTPYLRIESRARNAMTMLWPDIDNSRSRTGSIARTADAQTFGPHTANLLRAARATGIDARASRDAGSYLCNYLSWRAIEHTRASRGRRLAAFVHVPPLVRDGAMRHHAKRISAEHLVDAGEAVLLELVRLTRASRRAPATEL